MTNKIRRSPRTSRLGKKLTKSRSRTYERFGGHHGGDKDEDVCRTQKTYNHAFQKALDNYESPEPSNSAKTAGAILFVIWIIFLVWALILAIGKRGPNRNLDVLFAFIFPPLYVLADITADISAN